MVPISTGRLLAYLDQLCGAFVRGPVRAALWAFDLGSAVFGETVRVHANATGVAAFAAGEELKGEGGE